jgi:uncharacterized membrane protein YdbT with pleckstrin-like domain
LSFVDSNLLNGEEVVYRAFLHPIVYAPAAPFVIFGVLAIASSVTNESQFFGLGFFGLVLIVVAALVCVGAYANIKTSEFAVTNRRVLIKVGWLRRESFEILLPKVEGIGVYQGLLGRMFDFGTMGVRGTGGSRERFANIAAPLEFRRQVQALIPER